MNEEYEKTVTEIIATSGNARSCMIQAIWKAREGAFSEVEALVGQAEQDLNHAHVIQTRLLQQEVSGHPSEVTLLMVHAQDHLMTSITVKELATELIKEIRIRLESEAQA